MRNPFASVASWSTKRPFIVVPIALLIAAALGAGMGQSADGRISELFVPDTLEALDTLHTIEDIWGASEPAFFLYLHDDPTAPDLLRASAQDADKIASLPDVRSVDGLHIILEQMVGPLEDASDRDVQETANQLVAQGRASAFVADDALLLRIDMAPPIDVFAMTDRLDAIAAASASDADLRSTGYLYIERMQNQDATADVGILMPLSMVVVIVILALLFRRVQDVVVPMVTALVAIVMAYGTVAWAGLPIMPPSFIVMPLLLGLGIDYLLHIIYVYREQDPTADISERFRATGEHIGHPVFFTAITTLIGFGSFLASSLPQIRIWGLLIGSGALYAFLLGFTLMPALYRWTRRKQKAPRQPLAGALAPLAAFVPARPKTVIAVVLVLTAGFGVAAAFIEITPDIEFDPDPDSDEVQDFEEVQERYGGQTFAMFLIRSGDRDELERFEEDLAAIDGVGFVDGPIGRLERAGDPDGRLAQPATADVATDAWWRVTVGYVLEEGDAVLDELEAAERSTPLDARLTGQDRIQRESDAQFLQNIGLSTGIALGFVIVVLLTIFRHAGYGALAFMPLVVTMVWQLGIQSLAGIPLNPITAVMTAMMIGVGVDFAIHVLSHYRRSRRAGENRHTAAQGAILAVGKPVLAATITTVFAFSVLGFSSLLPLRDFGRVAAIVVACAFVLSLTFLPAILSMMGATSVGRKAGPPRRARPLPGERWTVRPRFEDPDVQAWFESVRKRGP